MWLTRSILLEHCGYHTILGYNVIWVENMARSVVSATRLWCHVRLLLQQVLLAMVGNGPVGDACCGTAGAECHLSRTARRRTSAEPRVTPRVTIDPQFTPRAREYRREQASSYFLSPLFSDATDFPTNSLINIPGTQ